MERSHLQSSFPSIQRKIDAIEWGKAHQERQQRTAMAGDRELVRRIQQSVKGWKSNGKCNFHTRLKNCVYDEQGNLTELHLCRCGFLKIPSEVWQCSSLHALWLEHDLLMSSPAEVCQLSS